jgi:lysophospholipase L1-like esterase
MPYPHFGVFTLILVFSLLSPAYSSSFAINTHEFNVTVPDSTDDAAWQPLLEPLRPRQGAAKPFTLRIMPLGASITAGVGTDPQNGYRKPLRDQLRWRGWPINMVGSRADGDPVKFKNRQHEGHPGAVVGQMQGFVDVSIPRKPNVILLNVGTNDCYPANKQDIPHTPDRLESLVRYLFNQIEGVTVILSTLLASLDADANANVVMVNAGYRAVAARLAAEGKKVVLAEMDNGFIEPNLATDMHDHIHPNERGAAKMAAVWDQAIAKAEQLGFLTPPVDTGVPDIGGTVCDVALGGGRGPVKTQSGSGQNDGPYVHESQNNGVLFSYLDFGPKPLHDNFHFAQLVNLGGADIGGAIDELILVLDDEDRVNDTSLPNFTFWLNDGGHMLPTPIPFDPGLKCLNRGVRWGDINGDGLDDFICINKQGNMYVSINRGGNPPRFEPLSNGGLIREGWSWGPQERVRLGDIDGDGRLDYCAIDDKGDIYCWRNGGVGDAPTAEYDGYWNSFVVGGPTFFAKGQPGIEGVRLVDINGDSKSDWVYVYEDGSTRIFTNQRGSYDDDGPGLRPHWVEANKTHAGAPGTTGTRDRVKFARWYGTGRADYVVLDLLPWIRPPPRLDYHYNFTVFVNEGHGATTVNGDGTNYCDMFGRGYDGLHPPCPDP